MMVAFKQDDEEVEVRIVVGYEQSNKDQSVL